MVPGFGFRGLDAREQPEARRPPSTASVPALHLLDSQKMCIYIYIYLCLHVNLKPALVALSNTYRLQSYS